MVQAHPSHDELRVLGRFFEIAEQDHEIQNPTSPEKLRLVAEQIRLAPGTRVLDAGCGRGGPAALLAGDFGCSITGVELRQVFAEAARCRVREAGLDERVDVVHADAREFPLEPEAYDVAICLGATFIWNDLEGTLAALTPAVRAGGHVVVGEPYLRVASLPHGHPGRAEPFAPLAETVARFEGSGLSLVGLVASSEDDWDRYESLHWRALEEWLAEDPDDPDADWIRRRHTQARDRYLHWQRDVLGWAIIVGWKVAAPVEAATARE